jgi:hypothetical protein
VIANLPNIESVVAVRDAHFDPQQLAQLDLLIEVSPSRFRFCVFKNAEARCVCLEDYTLNPLEETPASLNRIYDDHAFLGLQGWKNIRIVFNTPHFTLIPDAYFRKEYAENYLQLVRGNGIFASEQVLSHRLDAVAARNVFSVNRATRYWFLSTYAVSAVTFLHQTSALIDGSLRQQTPASLEAGLALYFEEDFLTIAVQQAGKLALCNKFAYKDAADMVYFVLFVIDTLQLKPAQVAACLYGEITPYSDDYQSLQRFLPNLSFGKKPEKIQLSEAFDDFPEHRYFSLYSAYFVNH